MDTHYWWENEVWAWWWTRTFGSISDLKETQSRKDNRQRKRSKIDWKPAEEEKKQGHCERRQQHRAKLMEDCTNIIKNHLLQQPVCWTTWTQSPIWLLWLHTRDENTPYCNAIWHYFSAILQILNTNRRVTDNAIRGVSGSDVALLALFWCKVALW